MQEQLGQETKFASENSLLKMTSFKIQYVSTSQLSPTFSPTTHLNLIGRTPSFDDVIAY